MNIFIPSIPPSKITSANYIAMPLISSNGELKSRFPHYSDTASKIFTVTDIAHCDAVIFPFWYDERSNKNAHKLVGEAKTAGKPVIFFTIDDYPTSPPKRKPSAQNNLIFKPSLFASVRGKHEHSIPALRRDTMQEAKHYGFSIERRVKTKMPSIGFCGQVASAAIREKAVNYFKRSKLETKFSIQGKFWGGVPRRDIKNRSDKFHTARKMFIRNILDCDFALCMRGAGNWSIRFYEALSLGRIPVLINTDCVLPFDNTIDWSQYIIIINRNDLPNAYRIIMDRYKSLSNKQFEEWQRSCRQLWVKYLSLEGFCKHLGSVVNENRNR